MSPTTAAIKGDYVRHNLPLHAMPFIGREDEILAIAQRLADPGCGLLTLVGPGGMGKTRLAVEVAKFIAQTTPPADGICFVDLQPVASADFLVTAISNALGLLMSGADDPRLQLLRYLDGRESLLLLDNFEHLLDGANLLVDIVGIASGVKLLLTSREALNMREEWVWQVGGLQVPDNIPGVTIEAASAAQLFAEHARRIRQNFSLAGQEMPILRICQLTEGMPLALELAAGWMKALSCAEIADEIQGSLDFLTTNQRNMPERHRSMQAVFEQSWRLLSEAERQVFPKLSVFRGGFRREAAEQVAGASLAVLAGLVDKSFLRLGAAGRYEIHELMRQYAEEHLTALPNAKTDCQDRHCAYYAGFLRQRQAALRGREQSAALDEIGDDLDNVRVSWEWAVAQGRREEIHQAMHSLHLLCHIRGQAVEGERLFELAVQRFEGEDSATLAYLLLALTSLAGFNGRIVGLEAVPRAIRLAYEFWWDDEIALSLRCYCDFSQELIARNLFDDERCEQVCRDFLERFRARNQDWGAAFMLYLLGELLMLNGKLDEAEKHFRESQANFLQMGDRWGLAWSNMGLARVYEASERYAEALHAWQEHEVLRAEVGDYGAAVFAPSQKAKMAWKLQDYPAARFYSAQAITSHLESGSDLVHLHFLFESLIAMFVSEGRHERAAELSSFMWQHADTVHAPRSRDRADQSLASLAEKLPPDIYQRALERGKKLHFRTILEQLQNELAAYSPPSVQSALADSPTDAGNQSAAQSLLDPLTERELEVLRLLAAGRSNREIAETLVLALGTVKWYISEIYSKLGVASRTQAVARAGDLNLLS